MQVDSLTAPRTTTQPDITRTAAALSESARAASAVMDCNCMGDGVGSGGQEGLGGVISVGARRGTEEDSWGKGRGRREKLWLWSRCFLSLDYLNASRDSLHPGWVLAGAARLALRRAPEGRRSLIMDGARAIRGGYHSIPPDTAL